MMVVLWFSREIYLFISFYFIKIEFNSRYWKVTSGKFTDVIETERKSTKNKNGKHREFERAFNLTRRLGTSTRFWCIVQKVAKNLFGGIARSASIVHTASNRIESTSSWSMVSCKHAQFVWRKSLCTPIESNAHRTEPNRTAQNTTVQYKRCYQKTGKLQRPFHYAVGSRSFHSIAGKAAFPLHIGISCVRSVVNWAPHLTPNSFKMDGKHTR